MHVLRPLILQVTTFTVAHTITLGLAATGIVQSPGEIIEPLIAISIVALAVEAIVFKRANIWRLPVIFAFGLLHGLGFGSVMKVYLENADLSAGLVGITLGVEAGHLLVLLATGLVASAIQLALKSASKPQLYRPVGAGLLVIALVALWVAQRPGETAPDTDLTTQLRVLGRWSLVQGGLGFYYFHRTSRSSWLADTEPIIE